MFISHLLDDVVTGSMVPIPRHLAVISPIVSRNFFHERFIAPMAHLEAGGFLAGAKAHLKKWYTCRIYGYARDSQFYSKHRRHNLVQCVHKANQFLALVKVTRRRDSGNEKNRNKL